MAGFPPDLPDLLRIACAQGKMRLHVFFSAANGHQASLANAANGWTVGHNQDPLVAIADVLRQKYGPMLARRGSPEQIDIEDAIAAVDVAGLIG